MASVEQVMRLLCVPVAMSIFLLAAQASGGFAVRDSATIQVALK